MDLYKEQRMLELLQAAIAYRVNDLKKYDSEEVRDKYDVAYFSGYQTAVSDILTILDDDSPGDFIRNWSNQFGVGSR